MKKAIIRRVEEVHHYGACDVVASKYEKCISNKNEFSVGDWFIAVCSGASFKNQQNLEKEIESNGYALPIFILQGKNNLTVMEEGDDIIEYLE